MNLNFPKIFFIVLVSITISLVYNHFNPSGLNLIRKEKIISWENDSIPSIINNSSLIVDSISDLQKASVDSIVLENKNKNLLQAESFKEPKAIKLNFAYKLFNEGIKFVDARSPEEFLEGHIKNAINIPFYGSENYIKTINRLNKNDLIVTYCSSADCDVAQLSGDELFKMGFKRVYIFVGGYEEWTKNNYPIFIKNK